MTQHLSLSSVRLGKLRVGYSNDYCYLHERPCSSSSSSIIQYCSFITIYYDRNG